MKLYWRKTAEFIRRDWHSHPTRLILETLQWFINVAVAVVFAVTVPNVPLGVVYPLFFAGLAINIYSSYTRGSFGLLLTSCTMLLVNIIGYVRLLLS